MTQTKALEHGTNAWGAKYLPKGFGRTPAGGLAIALGAPHYRRLVDDHPDNALEGEALRERITHPYGVDFPAAHAARRVRVYAAWSCDPDGSWRPKVYPAFEDTTPFTPASATTFIHEHLAKQHDLGANNQWDIVFMLEALVGTDVVLTAIVDAFEPLTVAQLALHRNGQDAWAAAAGILLLRASKPVGDKVAKRIDAIIERGLTAPKETLAFRSVTVGLHRMRRGHRAAELPWQKDKPSFADLPFWSDASPAELLAALGKAELDKWCFSVEPRLVMLAGDPVIDLYRAKWKLLRDSSDHRELVELFGGIDHPGIRPLIEDLAAKSKAKAAAKAWLEANGAESPSKAPAKKAPATKAPPKKAPAKKAPAKKKLTASSARR